jgi:cell wall-associated NlpC family hydrolase
MGKPDGFAVACSLNTLRAAPRVGASGGVAWDGHARGGPPPPRHAARYASSARLDRAIHTAALLVAVTLALALVLAGCSTTPVAPAAATLPAAVSPPTTPAAGTFVDPRLVLVHNATSMLGQPYRYGGSAPGGFDCSGLVVYAASSAGIQLPRTAQEQLHVGASIPRGDLQAGDLVFMHLKRKELHVGIAIDHDRFVHAPSTGGYVRIDSLSAPPYVRGYLAARRLVDGPMAESFRPEAAAGPTRPLESARSPERMLQ